MALISSHKVPRFVLLVCCVILIASEAAGADIQAATPEAIVLLAGNYQDRAPAAASLYNSLSAYVPKVLLTNDGVLGSWSSKCNRNLYQVEWTEEYLVRLGVPRKRIIKLPFAGSGTIYDALEVRQYALWHGLKRIILVTSDYHMPRALWTFRKVFSGLPVELSAYPAKVHVGVWGSLVEHGKFLYYLIKYGLLGLVPEIGKQPGRQFIVNSGGDR